MVKGYSVKSVRREQVDSGKVERVYLVLSPEGQEVNWFRTVDEASVEAAAMNHLQLRGKD